MSETLSQLEDRLDALNRQGDVSKEKANLMLRIVDELRVDDPRKSLTYCREVLNLSQQLDYQKGEAYALAYMGFAYYMLSKHKIALPPLLKARSILKIMNDSQGLARTLTAMAGVYRSLGNFEEAFKNALEGLKILQEIGDRVNEAWCLDGLGGGYHDFGDYETSIDYHFQSLEIFQELGEKVGEARALSGIGTVYHSSGNYAMARDYHEKSLRFFREAKNRIGEARALNDLGLSAQSEGKLETALKFHLESLAIRKEVSNRQAESTSLINLGNLYIEMEDGKNAISCLHKALKIAREIKVKPRIYQAHLGLSKAYEVEGNLKEALSHYHTYQLSKEAVFNEESTTKLRNLQLSYGVEKAEREAEIIRMKNAELEDKNEQLESLLNELRETQTKLIQSEKMVALGQLVAGIAHEMNTPVGTIRSSSDVTARALEKLVERINTADTLEELRQDKGLQKYLDNLQKNNLVTRTASGRISKIVHSLRSFAHLDEASFQIVDIHDGIESTLTLLTHKLDDRIRVEKKYQDVPKISCFPGELNQVFMHLLTNAIQAIDGEGTITIQTGARNGRISICFKDTGRGIPDEQLKALFNPAFNRTGTRIKTSLGLFTSFNILQKHGGEITVESNPGEGSEFTVFIPTE